MAAGKLDHRFAFGERVVSSDGYGNEVTDFADRFTVWAGVTYLRGSEAVIAARLEGRQPVVIRVRQSTQTRQISTDWRASDARSGEVYNIRSIVPTDDQAFFDITAERGVAV